MFVCQQTIEIACGAFALAAYLDENGVTPSEALKKMGDVTGSSELIEKRLGENLYEKVKDKNINNACSPELMCNVISKYFPQLGNPKFGIFKGSLGLQIRSPQQLVKLIGLAGTLDEYPKKLPLLLLIYNNQHESLTANPAETMHWVCRRKDGSYYDSGAMNGKENKWGDPANNYTAYGSMKWAGIYIACE